MEGRPVTCFGVYLGGRAAVWDDIQVLPSREFLKRLWQGDVLR